MLTSDAPTPTPDATDRAIVALYVQGRHTDKEIAEALGLHRVTVTRRRLRLGVTRKDREPARVEAA
jgi:DNA-binding CsgD family transcriptional regulator